MIDWLRFFDDRGITYVLKGPNVKKGHANIHCPYCGPDDPSEHMGVHLSKEAYGCWRSANHAGYKPWNLIRALLNCSFAQARLVAQQYSQSDPETLDDAIASLSGLSEPAKLPLKAKTKLKLPGEFRTIDKDGVTGRFWHYIQQRKFGQVRLLCSEYDIKCALTGLWKDRIIFPIYYEQRLVSWVGRAIINPVNAPRYRILGEEEGALIGRNDLIYNADHATGGKILFVVEGPIDTLKMDFYGLPYDCTAVCPMGTRMSQSQAMQIAELSKRYDKFILLYDPGEIETVFIVMDMLGPFGLEVGEYPDFVDDDVGALEPKRVEKLIRSFL